MGKVAWDLAFVAGVAAAGLSLSANARGAANEADATQVAEAAPVAVGSLGDSADLTLHYFQEDGPESGHVRIVLTPETRPLTQLEARSAAQQAFLGALTEPGLGDDLKRITVVVRLMPASLPDLETAEQIIVFLHKGGQDWAVLSGE